MKQEPCTNEISDELAGVLGRFNAWRITNGSETDGDSPIASWRLVYGQALESIDRLNQLAKTSLPAPSPAAPASTRPFLVVSSAAPRSASNEEAAHPASPRVSGFIDPRAHSTFSFGLVPAHQPADGIRIEEVPASRAVKSKTSLHRSTSVTVRLTSAEATFLKRKADEAEVTASAYLRKCAIDVERLSSEAAAMQIELEKLRRSIPASAPAMAPSIAAAMAPVMARSPITTLSPRAGAKKFAQRALATR